MQMCTAQHAVSSNICHSCHVAGSGSAEMEQGQAPATALPVPPAPAAGVAPSPWSHHAALAHSSVFGYACTIQRHLRHFKLH